MIFTATNSKDRPNVDGKNSAKCWANGAFAVNFADPQREFNKFHSLLGSVAELSGDKL